MNNHTIHNLGTIFPITNQHSMIHHQPTHIINSSTDLYQKNSISTASNTIDVKETPQINFRKRIQHQLHYPTHYHPFCNFHFRLESIHQNKNNDYEFKNNNPLLSHHCNHNITINPFPPYQSTIYII